MKKLGKSQNILISIFLLVSYIGLFIYTPSHVLNMNNEHSMDMPKETCPFIIADDVICNTTLKRDTNLLNINNFSFDNFTNHSIAFKTIIFSLFNIVLLIFIFQNTKQRIF